MMKSLAKEALTRIVGWMPASVQRMAIERVASRANAYEVFQSLGRGFGVKNIQIDGEYGLIEGSIDDGSILARYGRTKLWAARSNQVFSDFFAARGGGTYLDVGANIGLTTIPIARNAQVLCVAFEPEPKNYRYLERNIQRNCAHDNVAILNFALFDRQTSIDFELSKQNLGDHRIRLTASNGAWEEQARDVIQVKTDKLDAVIDQERLRLPLGVKIDAQGSECQIFAGGQAILSRAELVAFEYWPYGIERIGGSLPFLVDFVSRHFDEGALFNHEAETPNWRPIKAVAAELSAYWSADQSADHAPYRDHEVFLRKRPR